MKLRSVPFRFISEYDFSTGKTSLKFGSGDAQYFDGDLVPDLGDLSLPVFGKDTFTDFNLDPQNFLKTRTLGLAPVNTTLTIQYRVGGGIETNAGAGDIDSVSDKSFEVTDSSLNQTTVRDVANSFSVLNSIPVQGGKDELDVEEIRQLVPSLYASQGRVVTIPDFIARTLSMPSKFGSIFRANAKTSPLNKNSVELYVVSMDANGYLTLGSQQLKENLKTYLSRFRMLTDSIEILDSEIVNLGVNFSILTNPDFNKSEVLTNCIEALKEFFDTKLWSLNQPINLTDLYITLGQVPGVLSIISINFENLIGNVAGRQYSNTRFNVIENTKNGIIYCGENQIFEIKFKNVDIKGTAK